MSQAYYGVACDNIWLINSTVSACSSGVCLVFVDISHMWLWRDKEDQVGHC